MDKITNFASVRDNGKIRPLDWPPNNWRYIPPDELFGPWGSEAGKRWYFRGNEYVIDCEKSGFYVVDLIPDNTGILAIRHEHAPEAYILNGDASVRFVLTPVFNVRGHDEKRLALVQKLDQEAAQRAGIAAVPRKNQAMFHNKTERTDALEMFGDDGFGDCYYEYDSDTGQLLSARALPHRS